MTEATTPLWAQCRQCQHCWPAAYYPMEATKLARIMMRASCPKCGDRHPVVAKQDNGRLLEATS